MNSRTEFALRTKTNKQLQRQPARQHLRLWWPQCSVQAQAQPSEISFSPQDLRASTPRVLHRQWTLDLVGRGALLSFQGTYLLDSLVMSYDPTVKKADFVVEPILWLLDVVLLQARLLFST